MPEPSATPPLLEVRALTRTFPGVRALDAVDFELRAGEVHAVVGENGAGKSTLMNILGGVLQPDAGEVRLDDRAVRFADPDAAVRHGIGVVFQERSLAPNLSVAENLFANRQPLRPGSLNTIDWAALHRLAREQLALFDLDLDPVTPVHELSAALQQVVEILKAMARAPRILILDEPTSSLTGVETARLFANLRRLKGQGVSFIYISHHLPEIVEIADRVTVLRDGRHVHTCAIAETTEADLVRRMVGRELSDLYGRRQGETGPAREDAGGSASPRSALAVPAPRAGSLGDSLCVPPPDPAGQQDSEPPCADARKREPEQPQGTGHRQPLAPASAPIAVRGPGSRRRPGRAGDEVPAPLPEGTEPGPECLRVEGAGRGRDFDDVDLVLHRGEILGLAGLAGAGRTELARGLFGVEPLERGRVWLDGQPVTIRSPAEAIAHHLGYLTEDRKLDGLFLGLSVRANCVAASLPAFTTPAGRLDEAAITAFAEGSISEFHIATPDPDRPLLNLSGGNQQKVLLAMWMAVEPKVLIVDEPTRGVDVGARRDIYQRLRDLAARGVGLLLISSDLPEILGLSDRVLVMRQGRMVRELRRDQASEEVIMAWASGLGECPAAAPPAGPGS